MAYKATILADSINQVGDRLTTFELSYPKFVHNELMTHRALSRNTSSSRAVPVEKVIEQVMTDPVLPVEWGRNQRGMVADAQLDTKDQIRAMVEWLEARDAAVGHAKMLNTTRVHKQLVNRITEPWAWISVIASATDWGNFFALRTAQDAQPEIRHVALMMCEAYYFGSTPIERGDNDWHLPLVTQDERDQYPVEMLARVSAARTAAVSYHRQHDERLIEEWVTLCTYKLIPGGHYSPLEHPAVPAWHSRHGGNRWGNYTGWRQLRSTFPNEVRTFSLDDARRVLGK